MSTGAAMGGLVCFAAGDWWYHNRAHSEFQLVRRIADERPVLLVNSIGMRLPLPGRSPQALRRIVRKAASISKRLRHPVPEAPGFAVLSPMLLPAYGSAIGRAANAALVARQVAAALDRLGMVAPVALATVPTAWEVVRRLPHGGLVVNRADRHSAFGEADQTTIAALERQLLTHADAVVYASRALLDVEADVVGDRAVLLDHGVDLHHFGPCPTGPEPDDLARIPRPRVGFFGGLDDYVVDFALLERVARAMPWVSLVLVGDATCSLTRLAALPNVHCLGRRPYEEIPRYGAGFDVAIMPWLDNDWIRHCNPVKLKEYLALGLPVVSTQYPDVHRYSDVVDIATDADRFISLVAGALDGRATGTPATRRAAVAGDGWDVRAAELLAVCDEVTRRRARCVAS